MLYLIMNMNLDILMSMELWFIGGEKIIFTKHVENYPIHYFGHYLIRDYLLKVIEYVDFVFDNIYIHMIYAHTCR